MKKNLLIILMALGASSFMISCGGGNEQKQENTEQSAAEPAENSDSAETAYDSSRGEGKFHDVKLADKLDATLAATGEKAYSIKCQSCHKLSAERLVGPGWKDVTHRHKPEWIMNFLTNTDEMIDKDPKAQQMLEVCMVRMPNQNLSDDEARALLEFMRKNDGVK